MKDKKLRKRFTFEFKEAAIEKAIKLDNVAQAARELGLNYSLLQSWLKAKSVAKSKGVSLSQLKAEGDEIQRLKRENAQLKEENAIIKKAAAYFSQHQLKKNTPG